MNKAEERRAYPKLVSMKGACSYCLEKEHRSRAGAGRCFPSHVSKNGSATTGLSQRAFPHDSMAVLFELVFHRFPQLYLEAIYIFECYNIMGQKNLKNHNIVMISWKISFLNVEFLCYLYTQRSTGNKIFFLCCVAIMINFFCKARIEWGRGNAGKNARWISDGNMRSVGSL